MGWPRSTAGLNDQWEHDGLCASARAQLGLIARAAALALCLVAATGCRAPERASSEAHFDHAELAPVRLEGRTLTDQGLYLPFAIAVVGPYLVVGDRTAADSLVKVYRRDDVGPGPRLREAGQWTRGVPQHLVGASRTRGHPGAA